MKTSVTTVATTTALVATATATTSVVKVRVNVAKHPSHLRITLIFASTLGLITSSELSPATTTTATKTNYHIFHGNNRLNNSDRLKTSQL